MWAKREIILGLIIVACIFGGCEKTPATTSKISVEYKVEDGKYDPSAEGNAIGKVSSEEWKEGKEIITFAVTGIDALYEQTGAKSEWENLANAFNKENEKYYVELQTYSHGIELGDARQKVLLELGSGKGPDILSGDILIVNKSILEKKMLADLRPYMEASNITLENYFPGFANYTIGDQIYGACISADVVGLSVNQDVLGSNINPTFQEFVTCLLSYPEKASFQYPGQSAEEILDFLLCGSENLWGMIDWEEKSCDFSGPLFSELLDVAERYEEDGQKEYDPIINYETLHLSFYEGKQVLASQNRVLINYFFDDGRHPINHNGHCVFVNANTKNMDGAWAFLSYAMTKGQNMVAATPVMREFYDARADELLHEVENGAEVHMDAALASELKELIGDARYLPIDTETIRVIINDETFDYFNHKQSKEDTIRKIENRVQLYLDEGK